MSSQVDHEVAAAHAAQTAPIDEPGVLAVNNKLLPPGQSFHVITLSSGERVPTGTVAAFLYNLKAYDETADAAAAGRLEAEVAQEKMAAIQDEMRLSLPLLRKLGMFELFSVEEWGSGTAKAGRRFVAKEARRNGW
ncbi:hypothetical protein IWZ00DRAFT_511800 [Phyllosticta capitalensis]